MKKIIFCILILFGFGDIFCLNFIPFSRVNLNSSRITALPRPIFLPDAKLNEELHPIYLENRKHLFDVIMHNIHKQDFAEIIAYGSTHIKSEETKGMRGIDVLAKINRDISLKAFLQINEAVLRTFNRNESIYWEAFEAINLRGYTFVKTYNDLTGTKVIEELTPI